jgi:hypothetical protein
LIRRLAGTVAFGIKEDGSESIGIDTKRSQEVGRSWKVWCGSIVDGGEDGVCRKTR